MDEIGRKTETKHSSNSENSTTHQITTRSSILAWTRQTFVGLVFTLCAIVAVGACANKFVFSCLVVCTD